MRPTSGTEEDNVAARITRRRPQWRTMDELFHALGDISLKRVRVFPPIGRATPRDVTSILNRENRLYELIDGVLVEKVMGAPESFLALQIGRFITNYLDDHDLGVAFGADGPLK